MEIFNSIFSWIIKKRIHQIELFVKYPHEVQKEWLHSLLYQAKNTEIGKLYDFNSIRNYDAFKQRLPLTNYESIKEIVVRLKQGEQNITWPSEIKWFAKSSGTTSSKSKFLPVSTESLEGCHYKGGKDLLSMYCHDHKSANLFSGKTLIVGGSRQINQFSADSYYGDLSAIIIKNLPFWVEVRRTPNLSIALMDKWEEKIVEMAKSTAEEDVTILAGIPSWTMALLQQVLKITGKTNIHEVWPNLELYMHGGVNFEPYRSQFDKIIDPGRMNYVETYNASEGFFGIQDVPGSDSMLLMLDYGVFYEFAELGEMEKENPHTIVLEGVELDKNYALIITTNAGLWRYVIGDTVKFTSLSPFRIQITGRIGYFINAFGEELVVSNADAAITKAARLTKAEIQEYTAAPIYMSEGNAGGHEWLIEFVQEPDSFDDFTRVLDQTLKELNSDYEAKRTDSIVISEPKVVAIQSGTFAEWYRFKGRLGGQSKVPRLSNNRTIVEEILSLTEQSNRSKAS